MSVLPWFYLVVVQTEVFLPEAADRHHVHTRIPQRRQKTGGEGFDLPRLSCRCQQGKAPLTQLERFYEMRFSEQVFLQVYNSSVHRLHVTHIFCLHFLSGEKGFPWNVFFNERDLGNAIQIYNCGIWHSANHTVRTYKANEDSFK